MIANNLKIEYVPIDSLHHTEYNPRIINEATNAPVRASIELYGIQDPLIVNNSPKRIGSIVGGNLRFDVMKDLGFTEVPVIFVDIPDLEREKDLCLRLNKAVGEWDLTLLAEFDEAFLTNVGFDSEEMDDIFPDDESPTPFSLTHELEKLGIENVTVQKGDIYDLAGSRLMCGDSTVEADMFALFGDDRADMCMTDPPYILDYLYGKKRNGKATEGFGLKRDRKYLETNELPDDFTDLWMANVAKIQKPDFSIIIYEVMGISPF